MMVLGYLNISSTPKGARNITLMVSPDGNGKVTREELSQFMSRSTRTFGELLALMERDVMKPVYDTFIACRDAKRLELETLKKLRLHMDCVKLSVRSTILPARLKLLLVSLWMLKEGSRDARCRLKSAQGRCGSRSAQIQGDRWCGTEC